MQAHHRLALAGLRANHQRDVLAQVIPRTKCHDFSMFAGVNGQAGAGLNGEVQRVLERHQIAGRNFRCDLHAGRDEERRQDSGQPRHVHCRNGSIVRLDRIGLEGPAQGTAEVLRRIGQIARGIEAERLCAMDHHRRFRHGSIALVGEFERRGAGGGDEQARGVDARLGKGSLGWQQIERAIRAGNADRPAMAQRVERSCYVSAFAHKSSSVISGMWSEGCSHLRVSSTKRCERVCAAACGEAHMWSRRRP